MVSLYHMSERQWAYARLAIVLTSIAISVLCYWAVVKWWPL